MSDLSKRVLPSVPAAHKAAARPWEVYEAEVREGSLCGVPFKYLAEKGEGGLRTIDGLDDAELFNRALQRVDVTDDASVLGFVNRYGMPVSPMYQGKMRLEWFRHRNEPGMRAFSPVTTGGLERAMLMVNPVPFHTKKIDGGESVLAGFGEDLKGDMPYVLSECAREIENCDEGTVGAVSLAEVAQTIRALQMACCLPMAYSYFASEHGTAEELLGYLRDPRYVAQAGPEYFLHGEGPILGGGRLEAFAGSLASNPALKEYVDEAISKGLGLDAAEAFDDELGRELWRAAWDALRWLNESYGVCRGTRALWDQYVLPGESDFAALARWGDQRGLPDFGEYGSITEAIILQCLIVLGDEKRSRRCENCGRIFKKYREEGFKKNIRETRFCRRSCNVSFLQKNRNTMGRPTKRASHG